MDTFKELGLVRSGESHTVVIESLSILGIQIASSLHPQSIISILQVHSHWIFDATLIHS